MAARLILHLPMGPARVVDLRTTASWWWAGRPAARCCSTTTGSPGATPASPRRRATAALDAQRPGVKNGTAVDGVPVKVAPLPTAAGSASAASSPASSASSWPRATTSGCAAGAPRSTSPAASPRPRGSSACCAASSTPCSRSPAPSAASCCWPSAGGDLRSPPPPASPPAGPRRRRVLGQRRRRRAGARHRPPGRHLRRRAATPSWASGRASSRAGSAPCSACRSSVLDRLIGAMYADSRRPGAAFTELDLEILEALAVAGRARDRGGAPRRRAAGPGARAGGRGAGRPLQGGALRGGARPLARAALLPARAAAAASATAIGAPTTWHGVLASHRRRSGWRRERGAPRPGHRPGSAGFARHPHLPTTRSAGSRPGRCSPAATASSSWSGVGGMGMVYRAHDEQLGLPRRGQGAAPRAGAATRRLLERFSRSWCSPAR